MNKEILNTKKTILVLDGHQRSALAIVRSLGRKQLKILVASITISNLSSVSRYCDGAFRYTNPLINQKQFKRDVVNIIKANKVDMIIPVTDSTLYSLLKHDNINKITQIAAPSFHRYCKASNKIGLIDIAKDLHIPHPVSKIISSLKDWENMKGPIRFPLVFKPSSSILEQDGKLIATSVKIVDSWEHGKKLIQTDDSFSLPFLVQEKIDGSGEGIFALVDHGRTVCVFSHKRIREKPPWGGVSVLCKSVKPAEDSVKYASQLLSKINWHGVVMVEFKRDYTTKIPYLMEINARFWGTLQLAVNSGIDFPYWHYLLFLGKTCQYSYKYKNTRLRWLLGDFDNLMISIRQDFKSQPKKISKIFNRIIQFIGEFFRNTEYQVFRLNDIKPFIWELKQYIKYLMKLV